MMGGLYHQGRPEARGIPRPGKGLCVLRALCGEMYFIPFEPSCGHSIRVICAICGSPSSLAVD